ncbi:hypothetical protein G5C51_28895 [Streptomyces sp. A7024]|uniref:Uncharacterized protein n=1 Tax=Streptomyces coryli TaxID=1128680 RepID=A0A6G4U721_9ACTN|nr:hypothetical protein [Streptomyces coryli]NGN67903.1 hypothetical protein [Streptomyces coryli]
MEVLARLALTLAALMVVGSLLMLGATESGTPERTITLFSLIGGAVAMAASVALIRIGRRRAEPVSNGND